MCICAYVYMCIRVHASCSKDSVLRLRDLQVLYAGRPPLGPTAYRLRLGAVCKSKKAQQVARACALGLQRVCQELVSKGTGAATSG